MNNSRSRILDVLSVAVLIAVSVMWRYAVWSSHQVGLSNVELITASTIVAAVILKNRLSWIIPIAAVAISDALIPNDRTTVLYVWGAWLVIGIFNRIFATRPSTSVSSGKRTAGIVALVAMVAVIALGGRIFSPIGKLLDPVVLVALIAAAVFAVMTLRRSFPRLALGLGLGIGSTLFFFTVTNFGVWMQGWYPMTFSGLMTCYMRALPFLERQLRSTMILVPSAILICEAAALAVSRIALKARAAQHN